jgi:hypothetical protein
VGASRSAGRIVCFFSFTQDTRIFREMALKSLAILTQISHLAQYWADFPIEGAGE